MISIFAKPPYLGNVYPEYAEGLSMHRLSSRIRGWEIAEHAGFKLNPTEGFENDTRIWVKPAGLSVVQDGDWVDYLDRPRSSVRRCLKWRPKINLIAASEASYDDLKSKLPNKVLLIPSHHINFDREKRTRKGVTTCGYVGGFSPLAKEIYEEIATELKKIGIDFVTLFDFKERQDAIDLYKSIDILVVGSWKLKEPGPYKIPTKLINAASFGIPSVAYPMLGYKEIEGYYTRANNMEELVEGVTKLKDESYYNAWSEKVSKMAEKYHISEITKRYLELK